MSESFKPYVISFLYKVARGRKIEYNVSLKAFTIKINSWFTRTIFLNDLVDAWKMNAMKTALIPFDTPESPEECNDLSCEKCSIMHDTQHGAALPTCFYFEKSMHFLEMCA